MAKRKKAPNRPRVRYTIDIKIGKLGTKGPELREEISTAITQALQQVPVEVLEAHDAIVIRTNSVNGNDI